MARMPVEYSNRSRLEEIASGLFRLDLPMPFAIGPTNSYIFKGEKGKGNGRTLIVDAGCDEPETLVAYDTALSKLGISWDEVDVFITHFHWDHCAGLAQIWRPGMRVYGGIGAYEQRGCPVMSASEIGGIERKVSSFHQVGDVYDPEYWEPMTKSGESFCGELSVLHEGDQITVGNYRLRVLETPGHDMRHLCLYDAGSKLFVGGDAVLFNGYPPVMVEGNEDQLAILLGSNSRLQHLDAELVLCGHREEGKNLKNRCAKIADHYHRQVKSFRALCETGITDPGELAYLSTQAAKRTPWEKRSIFGRRSLIAQTMAYLKYLVCKDELPDEYHLVPLR
jgi:glyoxylase-like metal-dependent hydrolase (beta-lactamase superfamily II)